MKRRNLIALVAAGMLVSIALVLIGAILVLTRTRRGQDFVRGLAAEYIAPLARGKPPYIGHIDLSSVLTHITVDSIAIYDASGDVFFSSGRFTAAYDWRDFLDSRISLHTVNVEHPYLHLLQHMNDTWNFSELFRSSPPSRGPKPAGFSWGDYIVLDSVRAHDATFVLSMRWIPDDTLRGAALANNIQYELARTDRIIRRTSDGFGRERTWSHANLFVPYMRLADPDSDKKRGKVIEIGRLGVEESDPPFSLRHVAGLVRLLGDSLWLQISHWDLPASTGEASGQLVWGSDKPMRYYIDIRGDSVALNDVNWVYPALPRTGGGKTLVKIRNERDLNIVDYRLDSLDMRSVKSHLTGTMTFGAGAPTLIVRDVNLVTDPIDFDFLRTLAGKDFPIDWRGPVFGSVRGPGGPVTNFVVDSMQAEWRDTHVPGATSRFGGHGELNILDPALTAFHDFRLTLGSLDLRSIEYLFPAFPRLRGTLSGVATLDSSWEDVRFHDADFTHSDGPGDESHFLGSGHIQSTTPLIIYDVTLNAQPVSFDLLSRTYAHFPLRGVLSGPIRVLGQAPDLDVKATLRGTPGAFSFDGRFDLDSASGYKVNGQGETVDLDLKKIFGDSEPLSGKASGHYDVDLSDLFVSTKLAGVVAVDLDPSTIEHTVVSRAHVRVSFADGVAHLLDEATARGPSWNAVVTGGIGLPGGGIDSLRVIFGTDSLSQWRPYLASRLPPSVLDSLAVVRDSIEVTVSGRLDSSLALHRGQAWAQRVALGPDTNPQFLAHNVSATFAIEDALSAPHGQLVVWADSLRAAALDLDTLSGGWQLVDSSHSRFAFAVAHAPDLAAQVGGTLVSTGSQRTWRFEQGFVSPDSTARWQLDSAPAIVETSGGTSGISIDSIAIALINGKGGHVALSGRLPDSGPVSLDVSANAVALRELTEVVEHPLALVGNADLTARIRGTRTSPEIDFAGALAQPSYADIHLDGVTARGTYENGKLRSTLGILRGSTTAASADLSIPLGLSLPFGIQTFPDSALSGSVQGGNIDLGLLEAFFPDTKDSGFVSVTTQSLNVGGTWRRPRVVGAIAVHNARVQVAALTGVTLDSINGNIVFTPDSIWIDSLRAHSGAARDDQAKLTGSIGMAPGRTGWSQLLYPSRFDLTFTANDFAAYHNPTLALVNIQTALKPAGGIRLQGPLDQATLTGNLIVRNSEIYLPDPELVNRQVLKAADTSATLASASGQPTWRDRLINGIRLQNDSITLGDRVALRSVQDDPTQANVKLTGTLGLLAVASPTSATFGGQGLALLGSLEAGQGGTYTLDLGAGVRRPFTVMSGSTIRFDGTTPLPTLDPTLDIKAENDVKVSGRPDIFVIVAVQGTLRSDTLTFSSPNAGAGVAPSDLISYLLTGGPGFDFGSNPSVTAALAALLGPSFSTVLTSSLGRLGGGLSNVSFQGANPDPTKTFDPRNNLIGYVTGGRLTSQFQLSSLSSDVYLTVGSGLCVLAGAPQGQSAFDEFSQGLAAQLEYRLSPMTKFQFGAEPSTQAQLCSASFTNLPGLAPTPRQFSIALSHIWRW